MKENNIISEKQWKDFRKENNIENIPYKLERTYSEEWLGAKHFFGTVIFTYAEAKIYLKKFKIKSSRKYNEFIKTKESVINLPGVPYRVYENKGWIDWKDYLGYEKDLRGVSKKQYISYLDSQIMIKENNITSCDEWNNFRRKNKKIIIPSHPERVYEDQWKGWAEFLGKEK